MMNETPFPFLVQSSGSFDGNDGSWSTFDLSIGSPSQNFRVLVSTSGDVSWVPPTAGCTPPDATVELPSNCPELRGVDQSASSSSTLGFNDTATSSYNLLGLYQLPLDPDLAMNDAYGAGYNFSVKLGQDDLSITSGLDRNRRLSQSSAIFAEVTNTNLFLGSIGLGIGNLSELRLDSGIESLMSTLVNTSKIPSRSWGYTAGAHYRNNYAGNLVLGGYDQSRFEPTNISFNMPASTDQSLLQVNLLSFEVDSWSPLTPNVFEVTIDSTLPFLYFPEDVCSQIEQHLGLQYDNVTDLYLINDTQRDAFQSSQISVVLTDTQDGSIRSSIQLPYAAFDLSASWPYYENATSYFPIRRSLNGNNILGRAFLQEAYVVANYEKRNFSIAQAMFPTPAPQAHLVNITSNNYVPPSPSSSSNSLGGGAIAGIVIGAIAAVLIAALAFWFFFWKPRKQRKAIEQPPKSGFEDDPRRHTFSTVGTEHTGDETVVSYEMNAMTPTEERNRPAHSRHLSELSSDSEVGGRHKPLGSGPIYELEGGAPDTIRLQQNEQRVSEMPSPNLAPVSPASATGGTLPPSSPTSRPSTEH